MFSDKKLQFLLPEFGHLFSQFLLAKRVPALKSLGLRSVLDFLNNTTDEHIKILEGYFKVSVTIDKMDYHLVKNENFSLEDAENKLNDGDGFSNFSPYRDGNRLYISFWR